MMIEKSLFEISSFSELSTAIQKLKPEVSSCGTRYVIGYTEPMLIDEVASHMIKCLKQNPHFQEKDRPHVQKISEHINHIYKVSDEQVVNSGFFTRIAIWLREVVGRIFGDSRARWLWKDCEAINQVPYWQYFQYYTADQFQQKFNRTPEQTKKRENLFKFEGDDLIVRWEASSLA